MNSSAGCQVSAATCGAVTLVWGRLYGCIGLSWTVLSHTSHECSDISLDEDGEVRTEESGWECLQMPFALVVLALPLLSGEVAIPGKLRENWYLILFVDLIACFPFSS